MNAKKKKFFKQIQEALDDFPKIISEKKRRYQERQRFLKTTFGDLVKQLERRNKKVKTEL